MMRRPGAMLVSVGRGEVIDEDALAGALRDGPLDDAPNVIFTPHVAGITAESQDRILRILADDIATVLDGGEARHAVGLARKGVPR
jgi:(S)-sulfolactate dehydrogenase